MTASLRVPLGSQLAILKHRFLVAGLPSSGLRLLSNRCHRVCAWGRVFSNACHKCLPAPGSPRLAIPSSRFPCGSQMPVPNSAAPTARSLQLLAVSFLIPNSWLRAQLPLPASSSQLPFQVSADCAIPTPSFQLPVPIPGLS